MFNRSVAVAKMDAHQADLKRNGGVRISVFKAGLRFRQMVE